MQDKIISIPNAVNVKDLDVAQKLHGKRLTYFMVLNRQSQFEMVTTRSPARTAEIIAIQQLLELVFIN